MHLPHNNISEFGKLTLKPASPLIDYKEAKFCNSGIDPKEN
jgi:hypothetical protein